MAGLFHAVNRQHNPLGTVVQMTGNGRYTFGLALSAGLAGLLYGYDTVSISGAIEFLRVQYRLSSLMEGLVASSIMIGAVIGAAFAGFLSDRFGRRRLLIVGGLLFLVSAIWSAFTLGPYDLIAARVVGGFGVGLTASLAVTYITESAPTDIRGTLAFSYQMLTVCGLFLTNVINYVIVAYGTPDWNLSHGWRWMLGLAAVPAAVFLLCMAFAPESPRYLIQHGHSEEGFRVLEQVLGTAKARVRTDDIIDSVRLEREMTNEMTDLFRPGLRKALVIGVFLAVFNQAVGINVISYYGPSLFSRVGFTADTEFLASASVSGVELVFTVIGMYLIDAAGRKRLMAIGSALMAVFALCTAAAYGYGDALPTLVFVMLFAAAFAFSMGPIPWIVIPELFPTFVRGRATGLCIMCLLTANWAIAQFTPAMLNHFGGDVTFIVFAMLDLVCLVGIVTLVPETMGRTLEEIESIWRPKTELAAARYALSSAEANIRHAEATLVRVANERVQAEAIKDAAERARIVAQKRIFAIQTAERAQAERLSATRLAEEARRAAHTIVEPIVPVRDDALGGDSPDGRPSGRDARRNRAIGLSDFGIGPYADTVYSPYHRVVGFSMDGAQRDEDTMISEPIPLRRATDDRDHAALSVSSVSAPALSVPEPSVPEPSAERAAKTTETETTPRRESTAQDAARRAGHSGDAPSGDAPSGISGGAIAASTDMAGHPPVADRPAAAATAKAAAPATVRLAARTVLYGEAVQPAAPPSDTAQQVEDTRVFTGRTFEYHATALIDPLTGGAPLKAGATMATGTGASPTSPVSKAAPRRNDDADPNTSAVDRLMDGFETIAVPMPLPDVPMPAPSVPRPRHVQLPEHSGASGASGASMPSGPSGQVRPASATSPAPQDWSAIDALAANAVESLPVDASVGEAPLRENERLAFAMLSEDADADAAHAWLDAAQAEEEQEREDQALNNVLASLDSLIRRD